MNSKEALIQKGVQLPNPESVEIGQDIDVDRISGRGVTIHAGCKLYGKETFIADGARIGFEAPVTIKNCYVGPSAALKGGFFQEATFLAKSSCGLGSHVRKGTILEEEASIAHTVGLKQTILFPYVTLGSLINFCDCLMAGGTSRNNHSEVGSSYIHFNYTPNQDKATPSLMGDVVHGVMLNQSPIFLGGQGGLVGPCRIAYGTVLAAGSVCRKDQMKANHLVIAGGPGSARMPFKPGGYRNLKRVFDHNFNYIANLIALKHWYQLVRNRFIGPDYPQTLAQGLLKTLEYGIDERIKQLRLLKEKIQASSSEKSVGTLEQIFCDHWERIQNGLMEHQSCQGRAQSMDHFLQIIEKRIQVVGKHYLGCIKGLASAQSEAGTLWLQSIVDQVMSRVAQELNH